MGETASQSVYGLWETISQHIHGARMTTSWSYSKGKK